MALKYYVGVDFAATPLVLTLYDAAASASLGTATVSTGTYAITTFALGSVTYTGTGQVALGAAIATALNAGLTGSWTVTVNGVWDFSINRTDGGNTFSAKSTSANDVAGMLGLATATNVATLRTSLTPWMQITPAILGRSNVSDDYEPDNIAYDGEADDGSIYGISRTTAPVYSDWVQAMEPKASVFKHAAASSSGYATGYSAFTYESMIRYCRNAYPILVTDEGGGVTPDDMIVKLRAEGAAFKPMRVSADYDGQWNIPFRTRVLSRV